MTLAHREVVGRLRGNARRLRAEMTEAEGRLWYFLRAHRFYGCLFRRQVPMRNYIADFVCHAARLVVEVDGGQHSTDDHPGRDRRRTAIIEAEGYRVIRFWNDDVLKNTHGVLEVLCEALVSAGVVASDATPLPVPPPQGGRGRHHQRSETSVPSPLVGEGQGEGYPDSKPAHLDEAHTGTSDQGNTP